MYKATLFIFYLFIYFKATNYLYQVDMATLFCRINSSNFSQDIEGY